MENPLRNSFTGIPGPARRSVRLVVVVEPGELEGVVHGALHRVGRPVGAAERERHRVAAHFITPIRHPPALVKEEE